jgi:hypothetical protein
VRDASSRARTERYETHHTLGAFLATMSIVSNECRGAVMKCLACGAVMRLMDVRTDTTTPFAIARRVFQCSSCRQTAQRLNLLALIVRYGAYEAIPQAWTAFGDAQVEWERRRKARAA